MNAIVKAQVYSQENKQEVARLLSKDGEKYLPMKAKVVERAMTLYSQDAYGESNAIQNANWGSGRIDFQPWPFPSATKLIVDELKNTLVGGDNTFLNDLDPDFVVNDLVDYQFVKKAMGLAVGEKVPGFNAANPFDRERDRVNMSGDLAIAHSTGGTRHQARYFLQRFVGRYLYPSWSGAFCL